MKIPDEHWHSFETVGQLVDYIGKGIIIGRSINSNTVSTGRRDWQDIKDSFSYATRPQYKY
jgi:hypothetical protein